MASVALVHRLSGRARVRHAGARRARSPCPTYWLAARTPTSGGVALAAKLALLSALVVGAFVALGELDADDRSRIRAAWPRRRLVPAGSE